MNKTANPIEGLASINVRVDRLLQLLSVCKHGTGALAKLDACIAQLEKIPYCPFAISFSTVDMVPLFEGANGAKMILLGRKHGQELYQFCGGFRDPGEVNKQAAAREFWEEAQYEINRWRFNPIGEMFIDDNRYKNSPHKITTTIHSVYLNESEIYSLKGGDDIAEVQWFPIDELIAYRELIIRKVHLNLFDYIIHRI